MFFVATIALRLLCKYLIITMVCFVALVSYNFLYIIYSFLLFIIFLYKFKATRLQYCILISYIGNNEGNHTATIMQPHTIVIINFHTKTYFLNASSGSYFFFSLTGFTLTQDFNTLLSKYLYFESLYIHSPLRAFSIYLFALSSLYSSFI